MKLKRPILLALIAGVAVFGAVFGMAASLGGLNSTQLGAEDSVVAACDSNGVSVSYTNTYNTTGTAGYKVDDVTVSGIASPACDTQTLKVTLTGAGNASLAEGTATVDSTSETIDFLTANKLAEDVLGIHVVISS